MTIARLRKIALFVYLALIFAASSIPSLAPPGPDFVLKDKVTHFIEYSILGALLFKGIGWQVSSSRLATFGFLVAVGASVGALDELYQSFIPMRVMDLYDWVADLLGVAVGVGVFVFTPLGRRHLTPRWVHVDRTERMDGPQ